MLTNLILCVESAEQVKKKKELQQNLSSVPTGFFLFPCLRFFLFALPPFCILSSLFILSMKRCIIFNLLFAFYRKNYATDFSSYIIIICYLRIYPNLIFFLVFFVFSSSEKWSSGGGRKRPRPQPQSPKFKRSNGKRKRLKSGRRRNSV